MNKPYIAKERLYLNKSGEVVGETDPTRSRLLAPKGRAIPERLVQKYDLRNERKKAKPEPRMAPPSEVPDPEGEAKAVKAIDEPPANKAVTKKQTK